MIFLSYIIIPIIMALLGLAVCISKKDMFGEFTEGAREGLECGVSLLPTLCGLITAVSMWNACGAAELISDFAAPLCSYVGIPSELASFLTVRPVSGSASIAMLSSIFDKFGPDSFVGRCASVIMGSSDTLIYVITVYFGAIGIKRTRHTFVAAFITMIISVIVSCRTVMLFF